MDDATLVAAASSGDRHALDQLLRRHYDRIAAVCRRVAGRDADDATQEALIKIVRALPQFDGRAAFGTWAYRIATNAALDEVRKRNRRPMLTVVDDPDRPDDGPVDPNSHHRVDAVADRMSIDAALEQLPEEFRLPVVLRDVADLDYAEIAATLDVPLGTVKSRIARGRGMLAELLRSPVTPSETRAESGNHTPPSERPTNSP